MNQIRPLLDVKLIKQIWFRERSDESQNIVKLHAQIRRQSDISSLYEIAEVFNIGVKELLVEKE